MAVIDALDIAADVRVDGEPLTEYPDEEFDMKNTKVLRRGEYEYERSRIPGTDILREHERPKQVVVSKYIQAATDEEFSVVFGIGLRMPFRSHTTRVAVYVDGQFGDSRLVNWKYKPLSKPYADEIIGRRKGVNTNNPETFPFRFAKLNIVEEAARLGDGSAIGAIRVLFFRVISSKGGRARRWRPIESADAKKVAEKSLKKGEAVSHGTGYNEPQNDKKFWATTVEYIDDRDYPFAEIRFKFRSEKALQTLRVLPRAPPPATPSDTQPVPTKREDDDTMEGWQALPESEDSSDPPSVIKSEDMSTNDNESTVDDDDDVQFISQQQASERLTNRRPQEGDDIIRLEGEDSEVEDSRYTPACDDTQGFTNRIENNSDEYCVFSTRMEHEAAAHSRNALHSRAKTTSHGTNHGRNTSGSPSNPITIFDDEDEDEDGCSDDSNSLFLQSGKLGRFSR